MSKNNFRNLKIWQKAHSLALLVYEISAKFPPEEIYVLKPQLRRAAFSVAANIAEGCVKSKKSFLNHLVISQGSLEEVKYYLILACDLEYISKNDADRAMHQAEEIGKMTYVFSKRFSEL